MPFTRHAIYGDASAWHDAPLVGLSGRIEHNLGSQSLADEKGRLGSTPLSFSSNQPPDPETGVVAPGGAFSVDLPATDDPSVVAQVEGTLQYRVLLSFTDPGGGGKRNWDSGWFSLTADVNVFTVEGAVSPEAAVSGAAFLAEMEAIRDAAIAPTETQVRSVVTADIADPGTEIGGALSETFVGRSRKVDLERQVLSNGKGGRIGTAGRMPIAFRIDDGQDQLLSKSIVQKFSSRGWPVSLALCTEFDSQNWNQNVTWNDIRNWTEQHGAEIWSHGTDHLSPGNTKAGIDHQILSSKATIEAQGLRCMGWTMPGVAEPGYGTTLNTFESYHNTYAGQLVRETYALSASDVASWFRTIPSDLHVGLGHFTISDGQTVAACKAALDTAIAMGRGLEYMLHPDQIDLPGRMTIAQLDEVLAYVATKVASGDVVVVSPSTLVFCDPERTHWMDLLTNPRFAGSIPNVASGSNVWRHVNGTTASTPTVTRHDGSSGPVLQCQASTTESVIVTQQVASFANDGLAGQPLRFEGYARAMDSGAGGLARGRFRAETLPGEGPSTYVYDKTSIVLTNSWVKYQFVFTPPPWAKAVNFSIGRGFPGDSGKTVQWDDVHIRPA